MNINIICVGKLKESYWREAIAEYSKRISAYAQLKITELPESRLSDKPTPKEISAALESEAALMKPYIELNKSYTIAMCIEGRQLSSEELAKTFETVSVNGYSTVNIIIGSSFGLSDKVKSEAKLRLSISGMTLPHQLARVVVAEQVYRSLSIINHSKYHK